MAIYQNCGLKAPAFRRGEVQKRPDLQQYIDNPFRLFRDHLTPDIGLYSHTLDMLMEEAATGLYDLCMTPRPPASRLFYLAGGRHFTRTTRSVSQFP